MFIWELNVYRKLYLACLYLLLAVRYGNVHSFYLRPKICVGMIVFHYKLMCPVKWLHLQLKILMSTTNWLQVCSFYDMAGCKCMCSWFVITTSRHVRCTDYIKHSVLSKNTVIRIISNSFNIITNDYHAWCVWNSTLVHSSHSICQVLSHCDIAVSTAKCCCTFISRIWFDKDWILYFVHMNTNKVFWNKEFQF